MYSLAYKRSLAALTKCEAELYSALEKLKEARRRNPGPEVIAARRVAEAAEKATEEAHAAAVKAWREHWAAPRDYPIYADAPPEAPSLRSAELII